MSTYRPRQDIHLPGERQPRRDYGNGRVPSLNRRVDSAKSQPCQQRGNRPGSCVRPLDVQRCTSTSNRPALATGVVDEPSRVGTGKLPPPAAVPGRPARSTAAPTTWPRVTTRPVPTRRTRQGRAPSNSQQVPAPIEVPTTHRRRGECRPVLSHHPSRARPSTARGRPPTTASRFAVETVQGNEQNPSRTECAAGATARAAAPRLRGRQCRGPPFRRPCSGRHNRSLRFHQRVVHLNSFVPAEPWYLTDGQNDSAG